VLEQPHQQGVFGWSAGDNCFIDDEQVIPLTVLYSMSLERWAIFEMPSPLLSLFLPKVPLVHLPTAARHGMTLSLPVCPVRCHASR
jgi:hypothetical protein